MANLTLQQMIDKVAMYTRREIGASPYTGENLDIVNKIKDGINYAYEKICKEKYRLSYTQDITLDSNLEYDTSNLTKTLLEIKKINYDNLNYRFEFMDDDVIRIPDGTSGTTYEITYTYVPTVLSDLTDKPEFKEGQIDDTIICYYAAYHYLNIEIDSSSITWLNLFNEGFEKIRDRKGASKKVKSLARW
jgi:hypothetical protein